MIGYALTAYVGALSLSMATGVNFSKAGACPTFDPVVVSDGKTSYEILSKDGSIDQYSIRKIKNSRDVDITFYIKDETHKFLGFLYDHGAEEIGDLEKKIWTGEIDYFKEVQISDKIIYVRYKDKKISKNYLFSAYGFLYSEGNRYYVFDPVIKNGGVVYMPPPALKGAALSEFRIGKTGQTVTASTCTQ